MTSLSLDSDEPPSTAPAAVPPLFLPPRPGSSTPRPRRPQSTSSDPLADPRDNNTPIPPLSPPLDVPGSATGSPLDDPAPAPRTSSARSGSPTALDRRGLERTATKLVGILGEAANSGLTFDQDERDAGVWTFTDDEAADIGKPVAAIVARRGVTATPDLADALAALIVLASYVMRHLQTKRALRLSRRGASPDPQPEGSPS